jgi:hypothetical protein
MHERTLKVLRWTGTVFIWLGAVVGVVSLLIRIADVQSVGALLFAITDAIKATAESVGIGVLLLLLAEIVRLLQRQVSR